MPILTGLDLALTIVFFIAIGFAAGFLMISIYGLRRSREYRSKVRFEEPAQMVSRRDMSMEEYENNARRSTVDGENALGKYKR